MAFYLQLYIIGDVENKEYNVIGFDKIDRKE